jgi:hypothetical protein
VTEGAIAREALLARLQRVASHFGVPITELLDGGAGAAHDVGEHIEVTRTAQLGACVRRGRGVRYRLLGHGRGHALQPYR